MMKATLLSIKYINIFYQVINLGAKNGPVRQEWFESVRSMVVCPGISWVNLEEFLLCQAVF